MTERESYIRLRRSLFWSVGEDQLSAISNELLVEMVINFGTLDDVRELIHSIEI